MSRPAAPDGARSWSGALARAALALYPAAWRARYGDEVRALLAESGADLRTVASLAWRAPGAWVLPARHLYDPPARMRSSLATVLAAWTVLTGLALVFTQLTQLQGLRPPGRPVIQWSYWIVDLTVPVSVLVVAVGGLPLWWLMMRRALREHRRRCVAFLLAPLVVPVAYVAWLVVTISLVPHAHGVGPWWFLALAAAGFAAGGLFAAGPALAMRELRPRGPAVGVAMRAAAGATALIVLAGAASAVAAVGLCLWASDYAGYHQAWPLGVYVPLAGLAAAAAAISAARGLRAART